MIANKITAFNRDELIARMKEIPSWDIIIIGGGATGLGIALDAASRGYTTLLLEQSDFAKGTSSKSTKLVHGGVRYLAQGNIPLVYSALHERGILQKNAPHIVKAQSFIIPCYSRGEKLQYLVGLKLYDWLSGRLSMGSSRLLNTQEVTEHLPGIQKKKLSGGIEYFDGQFDDARLAINLAQTAVEQGAVTINYCQITQLIKEDTGKIAGVVALDKEAGKEYRLKARVIINATGVFVNAIHQMDKPDNFPIVKGSRGIHLVVDASFMQGHSALLIPKTIDGRVLFAIPWYDHLLIGTTDTPVDQPSLEPVASREEIQYILDTLQQYLTKAPAQKDVEAVFAGLRPLAVTKKEIKSTKELSRDHKIFVSDTGLITITGGKWTTYRAMAEDMVNTAAKVGHLPHKACITKNLHLHGFTNDLHESHLSIYGNDAVEIEALTQQFPALQKQLHQKFPYTEAEVIWAVRNEMARTVEDVLARRLRMLFLNAGAAMEAAPGVASLMRQELGKSIEWEKEQLNSFLQLAANYSIQSILKTPSLL